MIFSWSCYTKESKALNKTICLDYILADLKQKKVGVKV